jgi:DNA-binding transcriptional MerR regulator
MQRTERIANHGDGSPRRRLKIGELARRGGVGIETPRFYERQGLLDHQARTESGYRLYDEAVLDQLDFIKRARTLGFSLAEIAQLIAEKRAGQSPCSSVREIVRERLQEVDKRISEIKRYRNELAAALRAWDEKGDSPGHVRGLIEDARIDAPRPERAAMRKERRK